MPSSAHLNSIQPPLNDVILTPLVQQALAEDIGRRGDVTSQATIPQDLTAQLTLNVRQTGVLCGMDLARLAFALVDANIEFTPLMVDGSKVTKGDNIAIVKGNARHLLTAERTALNFLTHLSGIASTTAEIVALVAEHHSEITCTRKTIPMLRAVQKYAVRCGGGRNHRMGLDDVILIKDNHIAIAGDLPTAIRQAQAFAGHLIPIEVEVDTLEQLEIALSEGVELVLLDNMTPETLTEAVSMAQKMTGGWAKTEASGGITPESVVQVAEAGVDFIAMGYLTHSSRALDIGLDFTL